MQEDLRLVRGTAAVDAANAAADDAPPSSAMRGPRRLHKEGHEQVQARGKMQHDEAYEVQEGVREGLLQEAQQEEGNV